MANPQVGALIAGTYRLTGEIASGGMGSVWHATNVNLEAPVAVKFMHLDLVEDDELRRRFEREAKASARIRSPHVVHIHDHGIDPGTGMPFIVMEALEGEDLASRLRRRRKLEPKEAIRICDQICRGLRRAHDLGIVHRDLKPANVFLCERDDDLVKILDFGIAKLASRSSHPLGHDGPSHPSDPHSLTNTGQILGSPQYMSPEQVRGTAVDARSDLWSLAVILYRVLTGKRPFDAPEMSAVFVQICVDPITPPSQIDPSLPASVDRFFAKALHRDPDGRIGTAKYFADAFSEALLPMGASEPRPSTPRPGDGLSAERVPASSPPKPLSLGVPGAVVSGAGSRDGPIDDPVLPHGKTTEPGSSGVVRQLVSLAVGAAILLVGISLVHPDTRDAIKQVVIDTIDRLRQLANEPDYH